MSNKYIKKYKFIVIFFLFVVVMMIWFVVMHLITPNPLFEVGYSTIVEDKRGNLLGVKLADDEQWRFPMPDSISYKYKKSLICYEDQRFYYHFGIDILALGRAIYQNLQSKEVVSGASTITMQLARISMGNQKRTFIQKIKEINRAIYLECVYSKEELLMLYATHAPFGGNVIGIESAAWRYFGHRAHQLSWAEAATLSVLPNSPSYVRPDKNNGQLVQKRNLLLRKLCDKKVITEEEYSLACMEGIPNVFSSFPKEAVHLTNYMHASKKGARIRTTLDLELQQKVQRIADEYAQKYTLQNHIHNVAVLVAECETGNVLSYVGNASYVADARFGNMIDMVRVPRSTGSVLKPVLYAAMLSEGILLPQSLVPDYPFYIGAYHPLNFNREYSGAVPAYLAIEKSLNVPLSRMLKDYGIERFLSLLRHWGLSNLNKDEDYYGLSLIIGGGEESLWNLCGMYASLSRSLYRTEECIHPLYLVENKTTPRVSEHTISPSALWLMEEAMLGVNRPEEEADWQMFSSMKPLAWKTGTSSGGRDAWAIGMCPNYVIGVWVGNASGEGRAGMTGVGNSAPILFQIYSLLKNDFWYRQPYEDMTLVEVCHESGYRATANCLNVDSLMVPQKGYLVKTCPYHKLIHLDSEEQYRVSSTCYSPYNMVNKSWFILPPAMEYYYKKCHADYVPLPPLLPGCKDDNVSPIEIVFPLHNTELVLPKDYDKKEEKFVFRASHRDSEAKLYWHIDADYIGCTETMHEIAVRVTSGVHILKVVDENGYSKSVRFVVR